MTETQSSVANISEADLDNLMGDAPTITIDENNLVLGKKETPSTETSKEDAKNPIIKGTKGTDIPFVELEEIDKETTPAEKKDTKVSTEPSEEEKAKAEEAKKKQEIETKQKQDAQPAVNEVLKNTVNFLIEKGFWKDFEGKEEVLENLDEDVYAELVAKQQEHIIQEKVEAEINSTGDYGKAIIEYTKKGGNPDDVIDLFKEQKSVETISIDNEDGQKALIEKFYTEVFDWNKEKAKKYINSLVASDELELEAKEVKTKYQQYHKEQLKALEDQQAAIEAQSKEQQRIFAQTINAKLTERKDFTDADRKLIQNSVFKYDKTLPDGTKVNAFFQKFAEMQKNPDDYLDLVKFVMDKKGYNEKVKNIEITKDTDKKWSFLKGNAATNKSTAGSKHEDLPSTKQLLDLDFSNVLRKK